IRKERVPIIMFAKAPFEVMTVFPNVQAHLSAFSYPLVSYQAFRSGSVTASSNSWAMMDAIPSAPAFPLGPIFCAMHEVGQRSGLPMKAYLMSLPLMVPWVCHPQYWVQKPDDAVTSAEVRTKYTPFVSLGSPLLEIALDTTVCICASLKE